MRSQLLTACGVTISLCALASLIPVHTDAQGAQAAATSPTKTSGASNWSAPKTPWGHPDLQGVWTTDLEIGVPVERPVELGEKATLTQEEFQARAAELKKKYRDDKADRETRSGDTEAGPEHWYKGGRHVSNRTSLVIDPPNGRIRRTRRRPRSASCARGRSSGSWAEALEKAPTMGPKTWL